MPFLKNAWYVAAWGHEVKDGFLSRTLLGETVALYRVSDGTPRALQDRCPHRFVPLHIGKIKGDIVECGYHGLQFDGSGICIRNPHMPGTIPGAAKVRSYPLIEKDAAIWIWMGDPARADVTLIPDFSDFANPSKFTPSFDLLHVEANYQLITDNLLDLSHAPFLHPAFQAPGSVEKMRTQLVEDDETVTAKFWVRDTNPHFMMQTLGAPKDAIGDGRAHMRWDAPSLMYLDVGFTTPGGSEDEGLKIPSAHLLTPETETSTHYFWAVARNINLSDEVMTKQLHEMIGHAFAVEDKPVVEMQQRAVGTADLLDLKPVLLSGDSSAIRARRLLSEKIRLETADI